METLKANTRKTSSLIKKYLRDEYGINATVRTDKYSMGSSLKVSYDLGPDESLIKPLIDGLQEGHFNGMEDIYEYNNDKAPVEIYGHVLETQKYTGVEQEVPNEVYFLFAKAYCDKFNFEGVEKLRTVEDLDKTNRELMHKANYWTWKAFMRSNWRVKNFVTQDPEKISNVKLIDSEQFECVFTYKVDGVTYRTDEYLMPGKTKAPSVEAVEVPAGEIQIIEYSERSIAVIGETKPIKDKLKELGGKFNFRLTCGPGWIFPLTKLEALKAALTEPKETTLQDEIEKTVNWMAEHDVEHYGEVQEGTKEAARVQKVDIETHDNLSDLENAVKDGRTISLFNLSQLA